MFHRVWQGSEYAYRKPPVFRNPPTTPLNPLFLKILKGTAFKMRLKNQDIASFLGILLMQVVSFEKVFINNRDHSFSTNAKFSEKLIFLTLWNSHMFVFQVVRNVNFSEIFSYLRNRWSHVRQWCLENF